VNGVLKRRDSPPEVVERPAIFRKVRKESECEAQREATLNGPGPRLIGSFIDGG
jgi:hypothetical protein